MVGRRTVPALLATVILAASVALVANPSQATSPAPVTFDHRTGNEWWVEVILGGPSAGSVGAVQAMDTGGPWVDLQKRSWGAWAASFHIAPGHLVKFRAMASGSWVESCWFTHPAGVEQCGSSTSTTGPSGFDAAFANVKGNAWWVEARVSANQPLAGVNARVDCGPTWRALTLREWGAWAASFHIPSGSKVDFRARSTGGATEHSQGYVWPQATLTTSCATEPMPFDATFTNVRGNEWWVQAGVSATGGTLAKVDVRIDRSPWMPLPKQSWGGWAASYHASPGATVQLRATSTTGATDLSGCYLWTTAQPIACQGGYPAEGTFYRYEGHGIWYNLNTGVVEESWTNVTMTFTGGDWRSTCTERYLRFEGGFDSPTADTTTTTHGTRSPALVPDMRVGQEGSAWMPERCGLKSVAVQREPDGYHALRHGGGVATVAALDFRHTSEDYDGRDADLRADRHQGLPLQWSASFVDYVCECYWEAIEGHVTATNIPIGPQLTRDQQRSLQPAWPVAGSTVVYYVDSEDGSGWYNSTYVQLTHDGAAWSASCSRFDHAPGAGGPLSSQTTASFGPPRGTPMAATGSTATVQLPRECGLVSETMRVLAPEVHTTYAIASPGFQESSVEAVRGDEDPDGVGDEDAWWDPETGLLLEWNWAHGDNWFSGRLLHTDAPIR